MRPSNNEPTIYAYDGEGRRIKKTTCPTGTVTCTGAVSGAVTTTFVYDASGQLAAEYGGPEPTEMGIRYLFGDHLGSTRLVAKATGTTPQDYVDKAYDYLPFGEEIANGTLQAYPANADVRGQQSSKFTGHLRDAETGLDFMQARYYSNASGRFTSPDSPFADQNPADPQSWNLYAYGRNNPLLYVDPTGEAIEISSCSDKEACVQAIRDATGSSAAGDQVQTRTVVERGWFGRRVEHTYVEIAGDVDAFRATSENASRLADVVGSTQNVTFKISNIRDFEPTSSNPFATHDIAPMQPGGATSRTLSQNFYPAVIVDPRPANYAGDPSAQRQGVPPANRAERTAHELLGHIWADVARGIYGEINRRPNPPNKEAARQAENNIRNTQPGRGIKKTHD